MGHVVSLVHMQHASPRSTAAPCHINLAVDSPPSSPPLPFYTAPSTPLTSPQQEDPPSATIQQLAPPPPPPPPSPPPSIPRLQPPLPSPCGIETIPPPDVLLAADLALDFALDDQGLSTLEKIYLFSRSRSAHHRYARRHLSPHSSSYPYHSVFISHALPSFLANVSPLEAAEYVLPLLPSLAMDEGIGIPTHP